MPLVLPLIAAVVVPATVASIVVVPQDEHISSDRWISGLLDGGDAMELFADGTLHYLILFVLVQFGSVIEVNFVKAIGFDQ